MLISLKTVTAPSGEPLTELEAKTHLRVVGDHEDTLIQLLIKTARVMVEARSRQALLTQTLQLNLVGWPVNGVIELLKPPVQSVTSVKYVDQDGVEQTWDSGNYAVDTESQPGRLLRGYGVSWPSVRREGVAAPVQITYVAGYGDREAVPEPYKQAMLLLIGHWYEHREEVSMANFKTLPLAAAALVDAQTHASYP